MGNNKENTEDTMRKVVCPICGHIFPVRFYTNGSRMRYSCYCNECKKTSLVDATEIKTNRGAEAPAEA